MRVCHSPQEHVNETSIIPRFSANLHLRDGLRSNVVPSRRMFSRDDLSHLSITTNKRGGRKDGRKERNEKCPLYSLRCRLWRASQMSRGKATQEPLIGLSAVFRMTEFELFPTLLAGELLVELCCWISLSVWMSEYTPNVVSTAYNTGFRSRT